MYTPSLLFLLAQFCVCYGEYVSLKLVGGREASEGNVLVKRGSDWGIVCDDDWDIEDGNVVCRQLGYVKALRVTNYNRFHTSISEKVFLDDVKCLGHESNLGECKHREWLTSNCHGGEAAGVVCDAETTRDGLGIATNTDGNLLPVRPQDELIEHPTTSSLRIDIETARNMLDGELPAGQVSLDNIQQPLAPIADISESREEESAPSSHSGYSQRTRELLAMVQHLLGPDALSHLESSLPDQDRYQTIEASGIYSQRAAGIAPAAQDSGSHDLTDSGEDRSAALSGLSGSFIASDVEGQQHAVVQPRKVSEDEIKKIDQVIEEMRLKSDEPLLPPARPYRVEIAGGRRSNEGYVRVTMDNGKTGAICSDNWGIFEAMVVCRQAGKQRAGKATVMDYYGASSQDKVIYEVNCDGHERSLADCEYKLSDRHGVKCSKPINVAGVVCTSAKLPDLMPNTWALMSSLRIEEKPLHSLTCAMEENCLSSSAYTASQPSLSSFGYNSMLGGFRSGPTRRLLRFSSNIYNNGTADFRPKRDRTGWEWHSCHQHYHSMGAFSHYDLLDSHGNRVAEGHKASFCLEDVECTWPNTKKYSCRGFADQGISVGCADVYRSDIDCQWIDITDLQPGAYVFKLNVNPSLEIPELSFDNNAAVCELSYNGYSAKLSNCVLARG